MRCNRGETDAVNVGKDLNEHLESFAEVISLLEKNLRYVEALGMDDATLHSYRKILSHLRSQSHDEIERILGGRASTKRQQKGTEPDLTDEQLGKLKGEQIKRHLEAQKVSRAFLERLASVRFGVTKGALSMLRSREALTEKIQTLLAHEDTHQAISRAALGQSGGDPQGSDKS